MSNGRKVRLCVRRERHEHHVLGAKALYVATVHDAPGIGVEHYLEHHPRIVGRRAGLVVAKPAFENRQVQYVIDNIVESEFKAAGDDLFVKTYWDELTLVVGIFFIAGHRSPFL